MSENKVQTHEKQPVPKDMDEARGRLLVAFDSLLPEGARKYRKVSAAIAGGIIATSITFGFPIPIIAEGFLEVGLAALFAAVIPNKQ